MTESYSDDDALEMQEMRAEEAEQFLTGHRGLPSSERIRRSVASTDIAALMDTEMGSDEATQQQQQQQHRRGEGEVVEEGEHTEALPSAWIANYAEKFNSIAMNNRWMQPPSLDDRFFELLDRAVALCAKGRADGAVDQLLTENLVPLARKWYFSGEAHEHWTSETFRELALTSTRVVLMLRGLLVAGVGSRDINIVLWDLFHCVTADFRPNHLANDHFGSIAVDESAEVDLIKTEGRWPSFLRFAILLMGEKGFEAAATFFSNNITTSTSIEEFTRYLKAFRTTVMAMRTDKAFITFAPVMYAALDRVHSATAEEQSCKNLRGPVQEHNLYALFIQCKDFVYNMEPENLESLANLAQWRVRFLLRALVEAPFNGRMSAVENLALSVHEASANDAPESSRGRSLMKLLEEERAVDILTRDNLHNGNYVERVQRVLDQMLLAGMFTTGDLSTVWEAQRGKHDAIQRNLADLIVRIAPKFDNDLIEGLFFKIQAGWVDGGAKEREMLADIVRRMGENAAHNINVRKPRETDRALISSALQTLWTFVRNSQPGQKADEEAALQAHLKLLEDSRSVHTEGYIKVYAQMCCSDIQKMSDMAPTAARHLVHILQTLTSEDDEEDDLAYRKMRHKIIGSLETDYALVHSLCENIVESAQKPESATFRRLVALESLLSALAFVLQQNREKLQLIESHASTLWGVLITDAKADADRRLGFRFFLEIVEASVISREVQKQFFIDYVLQVPAAELIPQGFTCFEGFYKLVNEFESRFIGGASFAKPEALLGGAYVQQLILHGEPIVSEKAAGLWVESLQRIIDRAEDPGMTRQLVHSLVAPIVEQNTSMDKVIHEAESRGMRPTENPAYQMTKERTMRSIKVLSMLVNNMDDEIMVSRRGEVALGKAALGRPLLVIAKVPRREWESIPFSMRGSTRAEDLESTVDTHEHSTVGELREHVKKTMLLQLSRRRQDADDILEHFLITVAAADGGPPRKLGYADYKRTLGEMGMSEVAECEIRLNRGGGGGGGMRGGGDMSPDTSTSDCDWTAPDPLEEDREREKMLPSRALAADEEMIDRLLEVAESTDEEIATAAFKLLTIVPQNATKRSLVTDGVLDEKRLRVLLQEASDPRFLYYLMILEAIVLPNDFPPSVEQIKLAIETMITVVAVLPHVGSLHELSKRTIAFRSLAVISIAHMVQMACLTSIRVFHKNLSSSNQQLSSALTSLFRLNSIDSPRHWPKMLSLRRLSAQYAEDSTHMSVDLLELVDRKALPMLQLLAGVVVAAGSFLSNSPMAGESAAVLAAAVGGAAAAGEALLDGTTMNGHAGLLPALLEAALYSMAILAATCPLKSAPFIGAVAGRPSDLWLHALLSATFYHTEGVRQMAWSIAVETVEVVREALQHLHLLTSELSTVSLASSLLSLLPHCQGTEKHADEFVKLIIECVNRSHDWRATIERLDEHIGEGVGFLEQALLQSNVDQLPFPDETYLRARIEVLQRLIKYASREQRAALGSAPDGPRLCERLLADFIFPAARGGGAAAAADTAAAAAERPQQAIEDSSLPRSVTHAEIISSSSLFDLGAGGGGGGAGAALPPLLPRSLSALPITSSRRVPVCSGEGSQQSAFDLLLSLCEDVPANQVLMHTTFHHLFYSSPWTDKKDFEYLPQHVLRGEGDLVGLKNGGATCYMNSIFQQLFMIDEVREAVLNAAIPDRLLLDRSSSSSTSSISGANRGEYALKVLLAVQSLFAHLLGSELESYRPAEFWKVFAFKPNGESVNVREQQDAVEFHNMVTELIDEGLKKCGAEAVCERTFRGVFADEKICKDCPHRYTKEEAFESLSLDVRSHNNLRDSLKEYVKGDVLENDNAYHCELCNKKVKAIKRMSIAKLPEVLIVQLKRFDFDWEKEMSVKFNDYFEFPFEFDIQSYTVEGLERMERGEQLERNRDYEYMLRGVVVHSGQAQGGHYTSYIRNRETGRWHKFDDNDVTPWEASEGGAQQRWFGCADSNQDSMGRGVGRRKARANYWNAYMLFYEKIETAHRYSVSVHPSSELSSSSSGVSSMNTTISAILSSCLPSTSSPTPPTAAAAAESASALSPTHREALLKGEPAIKVDASPVRVAAAAGCSSSSSNGVGGVKSASPVANLHRHFSSMSLSLSSARIRMPPRLEEMLNEGNRRVQLERVQYSPHYFNFVSAATSKAIATVSLHTGEEAESLALAAMKTLASFVCHNGLFASSDLRSEDGKCSMRGWLGGLDRLLAYDHARLWLVTHVLFAHEIVGCFLFASDSGVRHFFRTLITATIVQADNNGDASEWCLKPAVVSPLAGQLAQAIGLFPRLSHLLAHLLVKLPSKYCSAFRSESIDFYRCITELVLPHVVANSRVVCIVRGGVLNTFLGMFDPTLLNTDLSSLLRKDAAMYENLHRAVATGLRTIRMETKKATPNPWSHPLFVVQRNEVPEIQHVDRFMTRDGGCVKFMQHMVDLIKRANRAAPAGEWAIEACLFICYGFGEASCALIDTVCQIMGTMLSETATEGLERLLGALFAIDDDETAARFDHLFHSAQLTSTHSQPSVQGLLEYGTLPDARRDGLLRVLLAAVSRTKGVMQLIEGDARVSNLLAGINTEAVCRKSSPVAQRFHAWYTEHAEAAAAAAQVAGDDCSTASTTDPISMLESEQSSSSLIEGSSTAAADSTMDEGEEEEGEEGEQGNGGGEAREATPMGRGWAAAVAANIRGSGGGGGGGGARNHHLAQSNSIEQILNSTCSPGQLSPSSRLNALTLSAGEKRPFTSMLDGEDEDCGGDRKRSIGETTMMRRGEERDRDTWMPPARMDDYSKPSPMDDADLLLSSSSPALPRGSSTGSGSGSAPPLPPPPAYHDLMRAGLPMAPPPIPPRPASSRPPPAGVKRDESEDEFVERHK